MQLVIADTGPINYLILIGHIHILPALFQKVILPAPYTHDAATERLDAGEEDAIALAIELHADLLLMDDRGGVLVARSKGFRVTGTLGILAMAAAQGLIDLTEAFDRIKRTSFHYRQDVIDQFLADALRTKQ